MAILVLIGLAGLAAYTVFSGPTVVSLPAQPQGAPIQTPVPAHGEHEWGGETRD